MKVGIMIEDAGYSNINFTQPQLGNPGVSGTVFEFVMLVNLLNKNEKYDVDVFHFGRNNYGIKDYRFDSHFDFLKKDIGSLDVLIVQNGLECSFYKKLNNKGIRIIVWTHNYLSGDAVELLNKLDSVKRIVFVGREQYDHYVGHDIIKKSTYIYNMFDSSSNLYYRDKELQPVVTYTGSIIPSKGFHMLAHIWKEVIQEVPDAKLYVLGSGKLYNRNAELGKYGIAEEKYEESFINSLIEDGRLIPSVRFCGVLGREKIDVYHKTKVGIMNPTGKTETFGLSGVEMQACGIPVITAKKYGCLDTVINGNTGYLIKKESELKNQIVRLLTNDVLNKRMGENAKKFVAENFSPDSIIHEWDILLNDIIDEKPALYKRPIRNYGNDYKWIMIINHYIRIILPLFPSIIGLNARIQKGRRKIVSKITAR